MSFKGRIPRLPRQASGSPQERGRGAWTAAGRFRYYGASMRDSDSASFRAGTFAALAHRNYRLWFIGQMVSLFGTWMQSTAQGYLVFQLTHSPAYLGYVGFAAGIPVWLFTMFGGVLADRLPRRRLLILTQ